jgi:hypothetical protein
MKPEAKELAESLAQEKDAPLREPERICDSEGLVCASGLKAKS